MVLPQLSECMFSLSCFNYYIWPICHNFSFCVYPLIPQHVNIFMFTYGLGYVCVISLSIPCLVLCRLSNVNISSSSSPSPPPHHHHHHHHYNNHTQWMYPTYSHTLLPRMFQVTSLLHSTSELILHACSPPVPRN